MPALALRSPRKAAGGGDRSALDLLFLEAVFGAFYPAVEVGDLACFSSLPGYIVRVPNILLVLVVLVTASADVRLAWFL